MRLEALARRRGRPGRSAPLPRVVRRVHDHRVARPEPTPEHRARDAMHRLVVGGGFVRRIFGRICGIPPAPSASRVAARATAGTTLVLRVVRGNAGAHARSRIRLLSRLVRREDLRDVAPTHGDAALDAVERRVAFAPPRHRGLALRREHPRGPSGVTQREREPDHARPCAEVRDLQRRRFGRFIFGFRRGF